MTTRGFGAEEMKKTVQFIDQAIRHRDDVPFLARLKEEISTFAAEFPLPR